MSESPYTVLTDSGLKKQKRQILSQPIVDIDLSKPTTLASLLEAYKGMSIQARNLGGCAEVMERMLKDPERPTILLGLAGPLIAAGLRKVIRDMIAYGLVDVVISTGAILYQDYYRAKGFQHYRGTPDADDRVLRDLLIDRIYDTYVDEEQFIQLDHVIGQFADKLPPGEYSSRSFLQELSKGIADTNSILGEAYRQGIPVISPALNDSSIGIGLTEHHHRCRLEGRQTLAINSIRDNYELTQIVVQSKSTAAIYVAGGVPKNFINDSIVMAYIFGCNTGGHKYAIQMTTDAPHWGGLSGSTLSEAKSWGKVNKTADHQMVFVEPSVSLPLIVGAALEKKVYEGRKKISYEWEGDRLAKLSYQDSESKQVCKGF